MVLCLAKSLNLPWERGRLHGTPPCTPSSSCNHCPTFVEQSETGILRGVMRPYLWGPGIPGPWAQIFIPDLDTLIPEFPIRSFCCLQGVVLAVTTPSGELQPTPTIPLYRAGTGWEDLLSYVVLRDIIRKQGYWHSVLRYVLASMLVLTHPVWGKPELWDMPAKCVWNVCKFYKSLTWELEITKLSAELCLCADATLDLTSIWSLILMKMLQGQLSFLF